MLQKLARRMGMGESGDEKPRVPAPNPWCPAHALSVLAFLFAILGLSNNDSDCTQFNTSDIMGNATGWDFKSLLSGC
jgi:hypothetical protein